MPFGLVEGGGGRCLNDEGDDDGEAGKKEPEAKGKDPRSAARRFMDSLKSKDSMAAENADLRNRIAVLEKQLGDAEAQISAMNGAVEAVETLTNQISAIEKRLGMKKGALVDAEEKEIVSVLDAAISTQAADDIAKAGVPMKSLPAASKKDEPEKFAGLKGLEKSRAACAETWPFKSN